MRAPALLIIGRVIPGQPLLRGCFDRRLISLHRIQVLESVDIVFMADRQNRGNDVRDVSTDGRLEEQAVFACPHD